MLKTGRETLARGGFLFACGLAAFTLPAIAQDGGDGGDGGGNFFTDSDFDFGIRYRLEQVSDDRFAEDATASTGRARFTWISGDVGRVSVGLEADYAFILGIEDFNSLSNDQTNYPIVADPDGLDMNQAFLRFQLSESLDSTLTVGRQRINHGSQRYVGGVAFRQNEQTYDAIRFQREGRISIDYSYLFRINRIFGPDGGVQPAEWDANTHIFRAEFKPLDSHIFTAHAYLLDFDDVGIVQSCTAVGEEEIDEDIRQALRRDCSINHNVNGPVNSTATWGVGYEGSLSRIKLSALLSRQSDWGDNPNSYSTYHLSATASLDLPLVTLQVGHERLGSDDGEHQFRTPLATLHKFNGWTDKYLIPPKEGVVDTWFGVSKEFLGFTVSGFYHDFSAAEGDREDGHEVGATLVFRPIDKLALNAKLARYYADDFASDTTKAWLMISWNM